MKTEKTEIEKQAERLKEFKRDSGLTYEEIAKALGYKNSQYMYEFVSGKRCISNSAAHKLEELTGWRAAYWMGIDDYKTEEEIREKYRKEINAEKEIVYIQAWNALLHEIAEYGHFNLEFILNAPDHELKCKFSNKEIPFEEFRQDLLAYSKFYIDRFIEKNSAENRSDNNG